MQVASVLAASSPLTKIVPGLMIWTVVFFLITFFVLRRYAFGPIQNMIDARREAIRQAIESADEARDEAHRLLEEHRKLIGEARSDAEAILAEARRTREAMEQRMREETEAERQRRLEETRKEIASETARALERIRSEVADLTLEAASRVVGRTLDAERDRALIEEAIAGLDFSALEESA
ncbi:MAG TPA: F0F1 ATP synthase subunit B [Gaiellaceae bacterium]|jgi:F-type H+-transporting ATPase subunit b|nr:F0F1 ATP synthase subunit B [Gaiellaceae bacterium]